MAIAVALDILQYPADLHLLLCSGFLHAGIYLLPILTMKRFIIRLWVFLTCFLALAFSIQFFINKKIENTTQTGSDNLQQTAGINADLVFIGSSRCWAHFDPAFFDSTFKLKSVNIGVDGHPEITMSLLRLRNYLQRNKPPKFLIYNFDPMVLPGSFTSNKNVVHKDVFARYAFFPGKINEPMVNYLGFNFFEKYIPLYAVFKYRILSDLLRAGGSSKWETFGYDRHVEHWDTLANPILTANTHDFFEKTDLPLIRDLLEDLKQLCDSLKIKLLCIQTPVYQSIYNAERFSETSEICKTLQIPFIDTNKELIRNNLQFFYNSNHINMEGVRAMNSVLKADSSLIRFFNR